MKIYLGTVNYLRDHIANLSILTAPLQAMITPYDKRSKKELIWTPELINAYDYLVQKVKECPISSLWIKYHLYFFIQMPVM
jgi:hypothetical protein